MRVLVLDTIHGGTDIARYLTMRGHFTDTVDVYRGKSGIDGNTALSREYDLAISPIHLDPAHPLLRTLTIPVVTHHEAVRWIIGEDRPSPFVEITGARGKTTTAWALSHVMEGAGVLHTSMGTYRFPGRELIWKRSITPANLIPAAHEAKRTGGWLIAEVSLGCTGAGDTGIITSSEDYLVGEGKRHALSEKVRSVAGMPRVIVAPGVDAPGSIPVESLASTAGDSCSFRCDCREGAFCSPLLSLEEYRVPLMLAAVTGCWAGGRAERLTSFPALPGRMTLSEEGGVMVIDNANSGTTASSTRSAVKYARNASGKEEVTLVVGKETGAVCEGFPFDQLVKAVSDTSPARLIVVGDDYTGIGSHPACAGIPVTHCRTLDEGYAIARTLTSQGSIVLSVKCWR